MGKAETNKKIKQNSLLNTAFEFFTTKGFGKTSISDIAEKAGVAKGTFYLYFKDKYDIKDRLVSHKSGQILEKAVADLDSRGSELPFEEKIIFICNNIIDQLAMDKALLSFISKNLSWGIFKHALTSSATKDEQIYADLYHKMIDTAPYEIRDPEIMIFTIIELVSSTCFSAILYEDPCSLEKYKPYLFKTIFSIIKIHKGALKNEGI